MRSEPFDFEPCDLGHEMSTSTFNRAMPALRMIIEECSVGVARCYVRATGAYSLAFLVDDATPAECAQLRYGVASLASKFGVHVRVYRHDTGTCREEDA